MKFKTINVMKLFFNVIMLLGWMLLASAFGTYAQSSSLTDNDDCKKILSYSSDIKPVYVNGGEDGMLTDLYTTLYNNPALSDDGINGRCVISFKITKEGCINAESIKVMRNKQLPEAYVNAAIEAIKNLGTFEPGKRYTNGNKWTNLNVTYSIVVRFPIPSKYIRVD